MNIIKDLLVCINKTSEKKNLNVPYCLNNVGISELCIDINGEKPQVHEIVLPKGLSLHIYYIWLMTTILRYLK